VAVLEAVALDQALRRGATNLARRFFAQIAHIVDTPWSIAAGGDLRMPQVIGSRTPMVRFRNWYLAKLHVEARHDSRLVMAFLRVTNLLAPPSSLLRPSVVMRVLLAAPVQMAARQTWNSFRRGCELAAVALARFT
jgi:hypothetical protein